jgi:hypothetical protein
MFKKLILNNPKSSLVGLASAILAVLIYHKVISTEESVLYITIFGAILGIVSKDGDTITKVITVVNEVVELPVVGNISQWYHIIGGGNVYWYYFEGTWTSVIDARIGGGTVATPRPPIKN